MKYFLILAIVSSLFISGCEWVEYEGPDQNQETDENVDLILKSASGYSSDVGQIYVQQGVGTVLKCVGVSSPVVSASWEVEGSNYEGIQITHKFSTLGDVNLSVSVEFEDGSSGTKTYVVTSVLDISEEDPVKAFSYDNGDGTWDVLFLFSKERIRHATSDVFYYNGEVTAWQKTAIPDADENYVIDQNGNPQITSDVGKYIGAKFTLSARGDYNIALIYDNENWANLSGSNFVKTDEDPGLAWFWFDNGEIYPRGDSYVADNLPGETGDNYFRFTQTGDETSGEVTIYFKLENELTSSAFVLRQLEGGTYSDPIDMWSVSGFPNWGQIKLPMSEMLRKVTAFRYGPDNAQLNVYSVNMEKSFFYSEFFHNLRVYINEV